MSTNGDINLIENGVLAHSCQHGKGPHHIKICITKTDNEPIVFAKIEKRSWA
jgi:hypothetical protein